MNGVSFGFFNIADMSVAPHGERGLKSFHRYFPAHCRKVTPHKSSMIAQIVLGLFVIPYKDP